MSLVRLHADDYFKLPGSAKEMTGLTDKKIRYAGRHVLSQYCTEKFEEFCIWQKKLLEIKPYCGGFIARQTPNSICGMTAKSMEGTKLQLAGRDD